MINQTTYSPEIRGILGEIRPAREIGKSGTGRYIWLACPKCGRERWVFYNWYRKLNSSQKPLCFPCAESALREKTYRGTKRLNTSGYITFTLPSNDFFYPMCDKKGSIAEHRLLVAKSLERCLLPWEVIHHRNGIKTDNRLENLELFPDKRWHLLDHKTKTYIKKLERKIAKLERKPVPIFVCRREKLLNIYNL